MSVTSRAIKKGISRQELRPTSGKVREAIFNILRERVENAFFLDLYAGTGAIGTDALKHGASNVVFVESRRDYADYINQIINKSGLKERTSVVTKKVLPFIEWAEANELSFDIIFLDPPYHTDEIIHTMSAVGRSHILRENGIVIAEHFSKKQLPAKFDRIRKVKDYKYGDTVLSFYANDRYDNT
ncbi:MAG: 16S rRNA (guanine(966)-N(2))-methyltransferase RsmD [Nitrospirae bacterium]|nr:16S rRNA (guanine(966)-N(2))-methyltransferase RsmD [Nitrospirota bacterium]